LMEMDSVAIQQENFPGAKLEKKGLLLAYWPS
jgi:hypothetical protein